MSKLVRCAVVAVFCLTGCHKPVDLGIRSFVGAACGGDVVRVDINRDQINLQMEAKPSGAFLRGTLLANPRSESNIYSLKEVPGVRIAVSPEDLVIYETSGGFGKFGVGLFNQQKDYQADAIVGVYNFVAQYRPETLDKYSFGTFEIKADGTWLLWKLQDGSKNTHEPIYSGSWVDKGNGVIQALLEDNTTFANLSVSDGPGGDLLVIDLVIKNGIALGMKKNVVTLGSVDGNYRLLSSVEKKVKKATVQEEVVTHGNKQLVLNYNSPWDGFIKDSRGEFLGIISPKGTYFGINIGVISGSQFVFAAVKNI